MSVLQPGPLLPGTLPRRRPERGALPSARGRYLLRILVTMSLTQGAKGLRQTVCPCFVVALRDEGGVRPVQGPRRAGVKPTTLT